MNSTDPCYSESIQRALDSQSLETAVAQAMAPPPSATPGQDAAAVPVSIAGNYGDMQIVPVVFIAVNTDALALPRPKEQRIYLIIVNTLAANPITIAFDRRADNLTGIPIAAGGNYIFDVAVPQNDLHIFSPVAGTVLVGYINRNILAPL